MIEVLQGRDWRPYYSRGGAGERRAVSYQQVMNYLTTLELRGGVVVRRTGSPQETAVTYVALWKWFNNKSWHEHTSHDQVYTNTPSKGHGSQWARFHEHAESKNGRVGVSEEELERNKSPSTLLRSAIRLPGVSWTYAFKKAEAYFGTLQSMTLADLHFYTYAGK